MRSCGRGSVCHLLIAIVAGVVVSLASVASAQNNKAFADTKVIDAIKAGTKYLLSTQRADGSWAPLAVAGHQTTYNVGPTALCAYALMEAGIHPSNPKITKALEYMATTESEMTYCVAFRALAFSTALKKDPKQSKYRKILRKDARLLLMSVDDEGGYSYWARGQQATGQRTINLSTGGPDHSNCQYGLLGIWAAALRGEEVPRKYWDIILKFWLKRQLADGGWGYSSKLRKEPYVSMTLAGLASIYVCVDNIRNTASLTCKGNQELPAVTRGMAYVSEHFGEIRSRPWFYYTLYGMERVALATGFKYFGKHDWYKEGRRELLARQEADGSWTLGAGSLGGGPNASTSYALLFLLRGSRPVLFNRLEYDGDWNNRPRSLANLTHWFSNEFEHDMHWQIVNFKFPVEEWHDAPLLVITGMKAPKFTDEQLDKLRTFVYQGGTIFSIAECRGVKFKAGIREVYKKLFPGRELKVLPKGHPIYETQYKLFGQPQLMEISNGARPLVIHTDLDLARYWQANQYKTSPAHYRTAANVVAYTNNKAALAGQLRGRGTSLWPAKATKAPRTAVKLARLKHSGNYDPEPLAYERFARLIGQQQRIRVDVLGPIEISELADSEAKLATLTGTGPLELTAEQQKALGQWLEAGGTLLVDAAGGDAEFSESAEKVFLKICGQTTLKKLASMAGLYHVKDMEINKAYYRSGPSTAPRLRVLKVKDRMAVYFSRDDITCGLIGVMCHTIKGYSPSTSVDLVRNLVAMTAKESGQAIAGGGGTGTSGPAGGGAFVASACTNDDKASLAMDGDAKTKWDTARPMKEGDWFQIDLGEIRQIKSISMDTRKSPKGFPKTYWLKLSLDGTRWAKSPKPMTGGPARQLSFRSGQRSRYVRLEVASVDGDQPWSIHELRVVTADGQPKAEEGQPKAKEVGEAD